MIKIIKRKDPIYSTLALYFIIDNNDLMIDQNEIIIFLI